MTELIYKDLSYKLTGFAYETNNIIGYGQDEKTYCDAFEELLKENNIRYKREIHYPIKMGNKIIKRFFFDFLIDDKIIIEFKVSDRNYKQACDQIFKYLKASKKKLGIIFRITKSGVRTKRIPNYY